MLILVSGGSASGKSEFAESLMTAGGESPRFYAATMRIWDRECQERVERHRAMRRDKGFTTLECPEDPGKLTIPSGSAVLLEDLSNLCANVYFGEVGPERTEKHVFSGVMHLARQAKRTVVVTNELFSDGICYDPETAGYLRCLAALNRRIAAEADAVYEVVCGIPVCWKGARV